jgi:GR25 family glycosyltransferase involved in LPS biosynthesis
MFKILNHKLADKGYYINLPTSTERDQKIKELISQYNIEGLHRFEALTDEMIQYSCTKSHLEIFKQSLNEDLSIIFVGEDDFNIEEECYFPYNKTKNFSNLIQGVYSDLQSVEWDVVLLGCNPKSQIRPITNNLGIVDKSTGAWAYLIKKRAYQYILEHSNYKRDYIAIDDYLPLLNSKGFVTLTTIPLIVNHAVGFESTLQPRGPVNYNGWIQGNYHKFLYDNYPNGDFTKFKVEKELTVVVAGHFVENHRFYLNYLLHSLPDELSKCKFIVHYDKSGNEDINREIVNLNAYFRDVKSDLNVELSFSFGGLISTIDTILLKIKTPYFLFLEHDWVFLRKDNINFDKLLKAFNNHNFINAVWFAKDDNSMRGFEIATDVENKTTPFEKEDRVTEIDLVTTCRWSNNPVIFRTSKMNDWYHNIIKNQYVGVSHQSCHNVEETMIPHYRKIISENKWIDIRDNWGTFLYGNVGEGPYVGHTDASRRYQGHSKSQPEINGDEYIKNNPL